MLTNERHQYILNYLETHGTITIHEISAALATSESTIRRDLQFLEDQKLLLRVHGGAQRKTQLNHETSMAEKRQLHLIEKQKIAKYAGTLIKEGDTIFLDAGSTTLEMIPYLPTDPTLKVVTNSVTHALQLLERGIETIILGGTLKRTTNAIVGPTAVEQLQQLYFDKAFLGMNGIDEQAGYTTPDTEEAIIKKTAARQSQEAFVLADRSKLKQRSFVQVLSLKQAMILTDNCPKDYLKTLKKHTKVTEV